MMTLVWLVAQQSIELDVELELDVDFSRDPYGAKLFEELRWEWRDSFSRISD